MNPQSVSATTPPAAVPYGPGAPEEPIPHPDGPPADMTRVRFRRYENGWRVYTGGDLLGTIRQDRVLVNARSGRKATRWHYTMAKVAWGLNGTPPDGAPVRIRIGPLPARTIGKRDAARILIEHLHQLGCPTVADLYPADIPPGGPHGR